MSDLLNAVEYRFSFHKKSSYKGKSLFNIESSGTFTLEKVDGDKAESNFTFTNLSYKSSNTNDPLLFSPVEWKYSRDLGIAAIINKKNFKPKWNRFRDKHRNPSNRVLLMVIEKLYFNSPLGMEHDTFSNGVYLPFFIDSNGTYTEGENYRGLQYLSMPLDIPLDTVFVCKKAHEREILLEGWVTLNEQFLDNLLLDQGFRSKVKDYHVSRDFSIDSKIIVIKDTVADVVKQITFSLTVKGEQDLLEEITYEVHTDFDSYEGNVHKIFEGKKYTLEEWEEFERDRKRPGRNFSLLDGD
ncbi:MULTISPECIES: hypothetical protein [Chryseobacterium]|uniref:Uncharacterized protein n=2 Tax=Chryseobacterium gleum TaxID=250 RepID=A0A448B9H4_CHRGE|nr:MULTISPECIES: hypothetical protein [Chryseobacterium]EFK36061.1 hypothetical protein HMPREF0204_15130 [Chryseobacterium gleum ATCC 35910]QQY31763.1 hypothetical protein I6I60_23440 [Chryseobacterium gleum]VEE11207.1 Uncharacterised protein [Chryseobacterium gleum]VFA44013.1 Uncharacterised protein [Chryseobacterium indologenes]